MRKVLYHANCRDGFAAAMAIWMRYLGKEDLVFLPVTYGELEIGGRRGEEAFYSFFQPDDRIMIVDFSYPRSVLERIRKQVKSIIVLDHHKTAQAELSGLDYCQFDMTKSGCRLAWEHCFPKIEMPALFQYIEDRDLWKFELADTRAVTAGVEILDMDNGFEKWELYLDKTGELKVGGEAILKYQSKVIENTMRQARFVRFALAPGFGKEVPLPIPVVNATSLWSEIGEAMNLKYGETPFSATYYQLADTTVSRTVTKTGKWKWSLRSNGAAKIDVSEVAKAFGGGGHASAAGFVTNTLEEVIRPWEGENSWITR